MLIDNLIIEITRRCNIRCRHCLRGTSQKIDLDPNLINKFLMINKIEYISILTFTGGEPLLGVSVIDKIVKILVKRKIKIGIFYMATNGTIFDPNIIKPLAKIYKMVDDPEGFSISISHGEYHDTITDPCWNLITHGWKKDPHHESVTAEGHGKIINPGGKKVEDSEWIFDEDDNLTEGEIYINVFGQICKSCDYSYTSQKKKYIGCCVKDRLINFKRD